VAMVLLVGWLMGVGEVVGWITDRVGIETVVRIEAWVVVRVVGKGMVERVETEVRLDTVVLMETLVRVGAVVPPGLTRDVGTMMEPAGPERYQFSTGSPRHSPTVTAL
jgi:hypothetical protein